MNRSLLAAAVIAVIMLGSCAPPVQTRKACSPGQRCTLEWTASDSPEEIWLDLRTTGGRELRGPVTVASDRQQLARGTFSLQRQGIVELRGTRTQRWMTTPRGARGEVRLFVLPAIAAGTRLTATMELDAGADTSVQRLELQVRSTTGS